MNDENIKSLKKNGLFSNVIQTIPPSLTAISRDLCNFGSFLDDNTDIGIGKCHVTKHNLLNDYLEMMATSGNIEVEEEKLKPQIKLVKAIVKSIYPIQKDITRIIENSGYVLELLEIHNYRYGTNLFYILLVSLYPNFHNFTNEQKKTYVDKFCNQLSFSLTSNGTLKNYNYRGIISENTLQNSLISEKERIMIPFTTLASFLSDYFNINIVVFINNLVLETLHHDPERMCLILFYKDGKYSIISNGYLTNLFPPNLLKNIYSDLDQILVINKLQSLGKYKIKNIQDIALKLNIKLETVVDGKTKKKTKNTLYEEVSKLIPR